MRRTNLVLDDQLLEQATRVLGAKTYSAAVNTALEEVIRRLGQLVIKPANAKTAAWASFCQALLGSGEFRYVK